MAIPWLVVRAYRDKPCANYAVRQGSCSLRHRRSHCHYFCAHAVMLLILCTEIAHVNNTLILTPRTFNNLSQEKA